MKKQILGLIILLTVCCSVFAETTVEKLNQYINMPLQTGQVYKIYVKDSADGCTTITFPSSIDKLDAGANIINVAAGNKTISQADFALRAKAGSYNFAISALNKKSNATLNVIYNKKIYILYLIASDEKAYSVVNFINDSKENSSNGAVNVSPERLISVMDIAKLYDLIQANNPTRLNGISKTVNNSTYKYKNFDIILLYTVRFNTDDTLAFVLQLKNNTDKEIEYDRHSFTAHIGDRLFYMSAADASGVMPANSSTYAVFTITGNGNGQKAFISPNQKIEIGITTQNMAHELSKEAKDTTPETKEVKNEPVS